jgi:hypothetical protein
MNLMLMPERTRTTRMALVGDQQLVLERRRRDNLLQIIGADGHVTLSLQITPAGAVLRFEGASLMIQADGDLAVSAKRIAIHGREEVRITSGGDATIGVAGDLETTARIQNITAELGNVNVKANDDVKLNGERILVNC